MAGQATCDSATLVSMGGKSDTSANSLARVTRRNIRRTRHLNLNFHFTSLGYTCGNRRGRINVNLTPRYVGGVSQKLCCNLIDKLPGCSTGSTKAPNCNRGANLNLNWRSGLLPENVTGLQRWRLWNAGKQSLALLKDKLLKSMQTLRRINRCLDTQSFLELLHYITTYPHCLQRESQLANPTQIESLIG